MGNQVTVGVKVNVPQGMKYDQMSQPDRKYESVKGPMSMKYDQMSQPDRKYDIVEGPQSMNYEEMSHLGTNDESVEGKKKLTEEEVNKEEIFKDFYKAIDQIKQIPDLQRMNGNWNINLLQSLCVFLKTYSSFEKLFPLQYDLIQNYQRQAGHSLSTSKSTSVICKVIMNGLKMGYRNKEGKPDTHQFDVISQSFLILMSYSDCTPEVTCDIAEESNFLETMKEILTTILPAHMRDQTKDEDEKIMRWCLTIYYNVSTVDDNIPRLRSLDIVPVMKSFLDAEVEISRLTALSTLANIIDEKESTEILQGKPDVIAYLLKKLGLALKDPHHRHLGWSAQNCARTVCRLARNDANKTLLVEMGCLPHLVELAKCGNVEEQREAVGSIQILSLKKDNHIKIVDDTRLKIVDELKEIKSNSSDKEVRKAVDITFWNLQEELQKNKNDKYLEKLHQTVLNRCLPTFVRDLDINAVLDHLYPKNLFVDTTLRDISDEKTTSDKVRQLIHKLQQRDQHTYEKFKDCLVLSKQEHLKQLLEEEEENVAAEEDKTQGKAMPSEESSGRPVTNGKGHIMISYNWKHQMKLTKIRDILMEDGYDVWMDIERMTGSVTDTLAKAVEQAHIILMCMSQPYKDCAMCKAEAEYAFSLKKNIIPLMMEYGYKPDGWLGFMLGVRPFIDFSGKYPFEAKVQELKREIAFFYRE